MNQLPDYLPKPSVEFGVQRQSSLIRTDMDSGRARQRRRFTRDIEFAQLSWVFHDYEFAVFKAFIENKVNGGADWFDMDLYLGGGHKGYTVRMTAETYQTTYLPVGYWSVICVVEIQESSIITEGLYELLLSLGIPAEDLDKELELFELHTVDLHHLVHTSIPAAFDL